MDIIDTARQLGRMIAASEQMARLKKAEAEIESDGKAKQLMDDYKHMQIDIVKATKLKKAKEELDSLREALLAKQQEINDYPATKEYLSAKSDFDNFMKTINDVMIFSITGEEPCSPNKCGSCGGCGKG